MTVPGSARVILPSEGTTADILLINLHVSSTRSEIQPYLYYRSPGDPRPRVTVAQNLRSIKIYEMVDVGFTDAIALV